MSEIASLIREFPFGSFIIITGTLIGISGLIHAFIKRNQPVCECDCCREDCDDEDDGEEVETEVGPDED